MYIYKSPLFLPKNVIDLTGMTTQILNLHCQFAQVVNKIAFSVSTNFSSSGDTVLDFKYRSILGDSSTNVALGSLTIPATAVKGETYYKYFQDVQLQEGYEVVCDVSAAPTSAGAGMAYCQADDSPESVQNNPNMILSA